MKRKGFSWGTEVEKFGKGLDFELIFNFFYSF